MNEIERAIKVLEEEYAFSLECDATQKRSSAYKTALAILRAELSRQENAPLTCEGCKWEFNRSLGSADMCYNCNRMRKKDRYEPKGENQ